MSVPALDDIIAPESRHAFQNRVAIRQASHMHGAAPMRDLLPWAVIDELRGSDRIAPDDYYLGFRGGAVPRAAYRDGSGKLRPDAVRAFLDKGASLVLDHLQNHVPAVATVAADLATLLATPVNVNAYLTCGPVSVFSPHRDAHDVFAVQIHGAKRWRLFGSRATGEPIAEFTLESGDNLFVPLGEFHEAIPVTLPSLHLTFGLTPSKEG